jgi:probable F420-dependent oxidoreductase
VNRGRHGSDGGMELGAVLPHNEIGNDPAAMVAWAQGVEALGCTHILLYDHVLGADRDRPGGFTGPYDKDIAFHEPLVTFGFLAACTSRVELVTAVLVLPQRQTVLVAKQAAEVALLSNDRLRLGVGIGWNQVEYVGLGVEFRRRGARLDEQVQLMRRLWSDDAFRFEGEFHTIDGASILPRPAQPIPVLFGGSAPAALARCARLGDGWMPLGSPDEKAAARIAAIRAHRADAGGADTPFQIRAQAQYRGGTPERWQQHAEAWRQLGATHLAVATHNAGDTDVDGHLARVAEYLAAVGQTARK